MKKLLLSLFILTLLVTPVMSRDSFVQRYPNGVGTVKIGDTLGHLKVPNRKIYSITETDFVSGEVTGDIFDETLASTGSSSNIVDGRDGLIKMSTAAKTTAAVTEVGKTETILVTLNAPVFYEARFKIGDIVSPSIIMGIGVTDTTPATITDAIYFLKTANSSTLEIKAVMDSHVVTASVGTLVDDTYVRAGFRTRQTSAGALELRYYLDGDFKGIISQDATTPNISYNEEMTPLMEIRNAEAYTEDLTVDYIFLSQERE